MIGLGFSGTKAGRAGICLLALAAAYSGLLTLRNFHPVEESALESCDGSLKRIDIALGRAEHKQDLLICSPPQQPPREAVHRENPAPSRGERPAEVVQGLASYYGGGDGLEGAYTASGEPFDAAALTAAHRTLPFGTRVRVTFLKTGKSVVVRINDRGPFVSGRMIDLSHAAATQIGLQTYGVGIVTIEILE